MQARADETWPAALVRYVDLLEAFVRRELDADAFEVRYLELYLGDDTAWPERPFSVLDGFFYDVDSYTAEERLRTYEGDIDGAELLRRAAVTLEELRRMLADDGSGPGAVDLGLLDEG